MNNPRDLSSAKSAAALAAGLAAFLTPFMASSVNIAIPSIGREFQANAMTLGWVATAYILAAAMCLVPFGRLADIHGRKKIFTWGVVLYTAMSLLAAIATSAAALIAFRIFQGVGGAMIFGTSVAILTSVYSPAERGKALGLNVAAVYLGLSLGPILGGFLTQHFGWRSIFLANLPLGLLILVVVLLKIRGEWSEAKGEGFDMTGTILYGLSLIFLMVGFSRLPENLGIGLLFGGIIVGILFLQRERKAANPILDVGLFLKNRVFAFSNLAALINYSATAAVGFLLSLYLQYIKGMSPREAGFVLIAQPIVMTIFSPLAGKASDRIDPRVVASSGMAISSAGLFLLTFLNGTTDFAFIVVSLMLLGFGFALFSSPNTNAVMGSVEKRHYGVASAAVGTMRLIGQMGSMGIAMMLFSLFIGRRAITPEFYPHFLRSARAGFIIFAVLCFVGIFASLARGPRDSSSEQRG